MQLVNEFFLPADRAAVWSVLTSPEMAVNCMPGATLTEQAEDKTFKASVSLKVGPVKLQFAGEGQLAQLAEDQSYGEMSAKGSDSKGRGGFKTDMKFYLSETGSNTQVRVETELTLTGSVAQYGRGAGIVKEVASQLTQEFTRNVQARVAALAQAEPTAQPQQTAPTASIPMPADAPRFQDEPPDVPAAQPINLPKLFWSALLGWLRSLFHKQR